MGSKKSWRYQVPGRTSTRCPCPWDCPLIYKFLKTNPKDWTLKLQVMKGGSGGWSSTKAGQFQHYYGSALASLARPTNSKFPPQSLALRAQLGESKNEDWLKRGIVRALLGLLPVLCPPWTTPKYLPLD